MSCVSFSNDGHMGSYCLLAASATSMCIDRPSYTQSTSSTTSVDGRAAAVYCVPDNVTCEAVDSYAHPCGGASDPPCGEVDGTETGHCAASGQCTYGCSTLDPNACPFGETCSGATSLCSLPP
jgi:hypothetical protein